MLTDKAIKGAKAKDKAYRLADSLGLHLYVSVTGSRLWRFRYEAGGKEVLLSFGAYPEVSLSEARDRRDAARVVLRAGGDPRQEKKAAKLRAATSTDRTFEAIARRWHTQAAPGWTERHAADVLGSLEADVFPSMGKLTIEGITPPMVLAVLRPIEARPALETARRVRQRISAVFVHAIASGEATTDPAAIVKKAMAPMKKGRQPAIVELDEARTMLAAAERVPAHPVTRMALRLLALTAVRPGELRGAAWSEFEGLDGPSPTWRIPAERMKMKKPHVVPLSRQAVELLAAARKVSGRSPLVFPNTRWAHRPLSENAIGYLLNRAGYHHRHVPHGWRATFSSTMNERFRADRAVIDLMLAHAPKDAVEAAYNRALHVERRRELAQAWADLLLTGFADADTLRFNPQR